MATRCFSTRKHLGACNHGESTHLSNLPPCISTSLEDLGTKEHLVIRPWLVVNVSG